MLAAGRETRRFLSEVREFLDAELTADLREAGRRTTGVHSDIAACRAWHSRLYKKGWIAPAWPAAYGGTGWSIWQRFLFEQECARADAPILFATGLRSLGPLLIAAGTPEQQRRYLPAILSGEDLWCQGFSEAGAGSDLAALETRAADDGENYIVTGRKLWTTGAHLANRMFALVRTQRSAKPQEGITFLLIGMNSPGIDVAPILTMDGAHEFNEVTFDAVRVPKVNRVGTENEGWAMAKQLMRFARSNNTNASLLRRAWRALERAIEDANSACDPGIAGRRASLEIELETFEALELRLLSAGRLDGGDEAASSLMKTAATELHQRITEFILDAAGPGAMSAGAYASRKYLSTRAASIYSGTNEIHRGVMARHLLRRW